MDKKYYYKAMNKDMKCRDFQFKVGEIYTIDSKELKLCSDKVFHFCKKLEDTIDYYNNSSDRHFLIESLGDIITDANKSGSNKIRIVREISREEIEEHMQVETTDNTKEFLALYSSNIETLEKLVKDEYWRVRSAIARNVNTPVYLLEDLSKDEDEDVHIAVAENLNTPVYILEQLSKDEKWYVYRAIAQNPNTPTHILKRLSKDKNVTVRRVVAQNLNTTKRILKKMAKDKEWEVRRAVAQNLNTTKRMLKKMAKDEDSFVREAVALNPNTQIDILEELVNDEILNVRCEAKARLKEITQ